MVPEAVKAKPPVPGSVIVAPLVCVRVEKEAAPIFTIEAAEKSNAPAPLIVAPLALIRSKPLGRVREVVGFAPYERRCRPKGWEGATAF